MIDWLISKRLFQLNVILCAPPPVSIPSAVGSASPTEHHLSPPFGNAASNSLGHKFGDFDSNQQQLIQNPTYGFQRPMYFPSPYANQLPFQMPLNFFENEKGMFYGNPVYRPFIGAPATGIGPYGINSPLPNQYQPQASSQHQYSNGLQSSPYQIQSALSNLSPFSRSSISQRKSDDLNNKSSH